MLGKRKCMTFDDEDEQPQEKKQKTASPTRTYEGTWQGTKYVLTDEPAEDEQFLCKRKATLTCVTNDHTNTVSFLYIDPMFKIRQQAREEYLQKQPDAVDLPYNCQEWHGFDWRYHITSIR